MDLPNPCGILVVEDDEAISEALVELLSEEGHQVTRVPHGRAALDYLQQAPVLPCLILLDVMMPVMTGVQFRAVQQLHPTWCDIPVVVLSAMGARLTANELADLGPVDYLPKPIDWHRLDQAVMRYCPL